MEKIFLPEAAKAVEGQLFNAGEIYFDSVFIDNRQVEKNSLFVAIKGDRFDGHDFIGSAFEIGAAAVISSRRLEIAQPYILVEDTRKALLDLARYYRSRFKGTVIGVTGSVGKTTTKEMVAQVLSAEFKTLKTQGNLNNEIGLPRTLFKLDNSYGIAVIEMGMSDLGEISRLSKTAMPNIGIITNIGVSHIENLGSRENILKAKLEILDGMPESGPLITNGDDNLLSSLSIKGRQVILCGIDNKNCHCIASDIETDGLSTTFTVSYSGERQRVKLPAAGRHNVMNALFAYASGRLCGMKPDKISKALGAYQTEGMRQNIRQVDGIYFIEDCYNASPDSMNAAIETLMQLPCSGKKVAVLGDMLELGDISVRAHYEVGKMVKSAGVDALFCYGKESVEMAEGATGMKVVQHFEDKDSLIIKLKQTLQSGDAVVFKASRGMRLEEVIQALWG